MKRRVFVDIDGTLAKWNSVENTSVLYEEGYFLNLEPNINLLNTIKELIKKEEDVYILSSFLNDSKFALNEKNLWLDKYLPEIPNNKRIFVKYGDNKTNYISNGINISDYLIDDYTKNLLEWREKGGVGIKYLNGINHTKGTWDGLKLKDDDKLKENLFWIFDYSEKNKDEFNKELLRLSMEFRKAIDKYKMSINSPLHEFLNAEIEMKEAKERFLKERQRLKELYNIEIVSKWKDNEDLAIHYKISSKDNVCLYEGYTFIEDDIISNTDEILKEKIMDLNVESKIDILRISPELKQLVESVLSVDIEGIVRSYGDDLLDSWDMTNEELYSKILELKDEIDTLGLTNCIDIIYSQGRVHYIDVRTDIISEFEFSNENNARNFDRTFEFNINGKEIICEGKYDEKANGYMVVGYTIDKEHNSPDKIQQVLTKEELAEIQGKLLTEINKIYEDISMDKDIIDDMF